MTGTLAEIIAAPAIEVFEGQDIRATIGAAVELAAPRGQEPEVWEDYVSAYESGRFAQSTRYVRTYPEQLPVLRDLLPTIRVPVHVFAVADDPLVPVSNGRYLADRIPGSELTILQASHFAWEEVADQFASIVADWVTPHRDRNRPLRPVTGPASRGTSVPLTGCLTRPKSGHDDLTISSIPGAGTAFPTAKARLTHRAPEPALRREEPPEPGIGHRHLRSMALARNGCSACTQRL